MTFKPVDTRCWERFLKFMGYTHVRTASSHDQWTKKNSRTIPVWGNKKTIPAIHIKTSCATMGIDTDVFYIWAKENC